MSNPTVIPDLDQAQWAQRILSLFPTDWTSQEARQPGGKLYSLFEAIGIELERLDDNVIYDFNASRIETAIDNALDAVAADYFGKVADFPADVMRVAGEPDESLRKRIKATLLLPAATRQSLIDLLIRLTDATPRVMEPWRVDDTAAWDQGAFFDIDTVENPTRYGDPALNHQGFVESSLPPYTDNQGNNPVFTMDQGAAWNTPSGYFLDPSPTWWINTARLDNLINKTKPFGTIVWRKYRGEPYVRWMLGGTLYLPADTNEKTVEIYPQFEGLFTVLANANWNTAVSWRPIGNNQFKLQFSVPAPSGAYIDWIAAPLSLAGVGYGPVPKNTIAANIGILEEFQTHNIFISPTWNTNYWLSSRDSDQAVFEFSTESGEGDSISYAYFSIDDSGVVEVPADVSRVFIPITKVDPLQVLALPTWNTSYSVIKSPNLIEIAFGTPPDEDRLCYWAIHES